jgi:hypothetical protein
MRRKVFWFFIVSLVLVACNGKPTKTEGEIQEQNADSALAEEDTATLSAMEKEVAEPPKSVDELFDDFIFNFTASKRFQLKRTQFPLTSTTNGVISHIQRGRWHFLHLFLQNDYYSVLYDHERQMKIEKDTTINDVSVNWLYLVEHRIRKFNFKRVNGLWMLVSIDTHALGVNENADFLAFYQTFVTDSAFQRRHVANPLRFITTDAENDYEPIEGTVDVDQWFLFRPELP